MPLSSSVLKAGVVKVVALFGVFYSMQCFTLFITILLRNIMPPSSSWTTDSHTMFPTHHPQTINRWFYFNSHTQDWTANVMCCGLQKPLSKWSVAIQSGYSCGPVWATLVRLSCKLSVGQGDGAWKPKYLTKWAQSETTVEKIMHRNETINCIITNSWFVIASASYNATF
jgi:hypothetical protein